MVLPPGVLPPDRSQTFGGFRDPEDAAKPRTIAEALRDAGAPPEERDQLLLLLARWELPSNTLISCLLMRGGDVANEKLAARWQDYWVELRLIAPEGQAMACPWRLDVGRQPTEPWRVPEPSNDPITITPTSDRGPLVVLRQRLWHPQRRDFLEGYWERDLRRVRWSLRDLDPRIDQAELNEWLRLVRLLNHHGRPHGSGVYPNSAHFLYRCRQAKAELPPGHHLERAHMAAVLGIDEKTWRTTLKRHGLTWTDILALAPASGANCRPLFPAV